MNAFVVTALNPKGIVFFIAFLPQFLDPARDTLVQFAIMEATFLTLAGLNIILWVILIDRLKRGLASSGILQYVNKVGGTCLIGAGMLAAISQRAS